jgi:hypothetical protein
LIFIEGKEIRKLWGRMDHEQMEIHNSSGMDQRTDQQGSSAAFFRRK